MLDLPWPIYKCGSCGLSQVFPLPQSVEIQKLYQGDYWKNYGPYGSQVNAHKAYFKKKIKEIKKYIPQGKLLDVGCALGTFMEEAQTAGFWPEGIDISDYAVKKCQKRGLDATTGTITVVNKKNYYHVVTAFEVIEHEHNPLSTINTARQLLKNGGLLVVTVPDSDSLTSRLMGKNWFGYRNKEHLFHFTEKSLRLLLRKGGFTTIEIKKDIGRPYLFIYSLERLNYYLCKSSLLTKLILWLKKIPIVDALSIPFNPWGNLIALAYKHRRRQHVPGKHSLA